MRCSLMVAKDLYVLSAEIDAQRKRHAASATTEADVAAVEQLATARRRIGDEVDRRRGDYEARVASV
jgi:hypothetical protein